MKVENLEDNLALIANKIDEAINAYKAEIEEKIGVTVFEVPWVKYSIEEINDGENHRYYAKLYYEDKFLMGDRSNQKYSRKVFGKLCLQKESCGYLDAKTKRYHKNYAMVTVGNANDRSYFFIVGDIKKRMLGCAKECKDYLAKSQDEKERERREIEDTKKKEHLREMFKKIDLIGKSLNDKVKMYKAVRAVARGKVEFDKFGHYGDDVFLFCLGYNGVSVLSMKKADVIALCKEIVDVFEPWTITKEDN